MAKKQETLSETMARAFAALIKKNLAYALGCESGVVTYNTAAGRALIGEGLAERSSTGSDYVHLTPAGCMLRDALRAELEAEYPEQPEPEPVQDEPTQPVPAPMFTPDPEPVPPAATAAIEVRSACAGCGRPDVGGKCPDCFERSEMSHLPEGVVTSLREQAAARSKS